MKKTLSFPGKGWICQLAAISAIALLSGAAQADITAVQAQAMAEYSANQTATFLVGVLGACASTYPETRTDVVKALRSMRSTTLEDEEASKIIGSVARCMSNTEVPTKSQCSDLATQLPSGRFDPDDKRFEPVLMAGLAMLEPCRRGK
jgi:hypothetical protein